MTQIIVIEMKWCFQKRLLYYKHVLTVLDRKLDYLDDRQNNAGKHIYAVDKIRHKIRSNLT